MLLETECINEIWLLVEILDDRSLVVPPMEVHEHERSHHRYDRLGLGVPRRMNIMRLEVEIMERPPADERLYVIMGVVCEPRALFNRLNTA
jgi:hypothetical protein